MKKPVLVSAFLCLTYLATSHAKASTPFVVVTEGPSITNSGELLFQEKNVRIFRVQDSSQEEFRNLYIAHAPMNESAESLSEFGELLYFKKHLAIIKLEGDNVAKLSSRLHGEGLACGSVIRLDGTPVATKVNPPPTPILPVALVNADVANALAQVNEQNLRNTIAEMSKIPTRFHNSSTQSQVLDLLENRYDAYLDGNTNVTVGRYSHEKDTPQSSLVVRIQGKVHPDEIVVLGSHIDSVNWMDGTSQRAPGSDDNASGTATNLEVFRILMENHIVPDRTIEIHGYAAEEIGLVGSNNMAKRYKESGKNVVSMLQNDMNLYRSQNSIEKIWFIENNTDRTFNAMMGKIVENYLHLPWETRFLWGGDSDHTSWRRQGYATTFPFENPSDYNENIHSRDDTVENSGDFEQSVVYTKLSLAYVLHFAGL